MIRIDPASRADVPLILSLIKEFATFIHLDHEVTATQESLQAALFGTQPYAQVILARLDDRPAGFALFFHNYSTFLGQPGIYLEDLFVRPEFRGRGIGKALMHHLARLAIERKCGRFEWAVLKWNEAAMKFYARLGAVPLDHLRGYRLSGEALEKLAEI